MPWHPLVLLHCCSLSPSQAGCGLVAATHFGAHDGQSSIEQYIGQIGYSTSQPGVARQVFSLSELQSIFSDVELSISSSEPSVGEIVHAAAVKRTSAPRVIFTGKSPKKTKFACPQSTAHAVRHSAE